MARYVDLQVGFIKILTGISYAVSFQDESREIASDYAGGAARYAPFQTKCSSKPRRTPESISSTATIASVSSSSHPTLPPILPLLPLPSAECNTTGFEDMQGKKHWHSDSYAHSTASDISSLTSTTMSSNDLLPTNHPTRDTISSQEQTLFMQVFVEEVGLWMDSLDPAKHVGFSTP